MTIKKIREDLYEIRFYYSHKDVFENEAKELGTPSIMKTVIKYKDIVQKAPSRLYELYFSLYIDNNTIESLSNKSGYSYAYIQKLNNKLIKFIHDNIKDEKEEIV